MDRVLNRFYDKEGEGALYLNSIYYEALYVLTSYFRIKADDSRLKDDVTPDNSACLRYRIMYRQIIRSRLV